MKDAYKNLPDEIKNNKAIAEQIKYQQERQAELRLKRRKRLSFAMGIAVVIFSLIGFASVILRCALFVKNKAEEKKQLEYNSYNRFLLAVAAVDPIPFDDVAAAPMEKLIEIAVWSIIGSDLDPNKYDYSSGELAIPAAEVEKAFDIYFGSQTAIKHYSVTGYGYEFRYDAEKNIYYIPLTTIEPLYTPKVIDIETRGGATEITCGLINSNAWLQDSTTGKISPPEPDKYIKVTLREFGGKTCLSSIQSSAPLETAAVHMSIPPPRTSAVNPSETAAETTLQETSAAATTQ